MPSWAVTSHRQRAILESELKRCHLCVHAVASSTQAGLQPKCVCVMVGPTGCVLMALTEAGSELLRPCSAVGRLCSGISLSLAERCADRHLAQCASERLHPGSILAWAARSSCSFLGPCVGLWLPGVFRCLSSFALGILGMGRPLGSARSELSVMCTRQSGRAWRGNSAQTIDAGGRSCVLMP